MVSIVVEGSVRGMSGTWYQRMLFVKGQHIEHEHVHEHHKAVGCGGDGEGIPCQDMIAMCLCVAVWAVVEYDGKGSV